MRSGDLNSGIDVYETMTSEEAKDQTLDLMLRHRLGDDYFLPEDIRKAVPKLTKGMIKEQITWEPGLNAFVLHYRGTAGDLISHLPDSESDSDNLPPAPATWLDNHMRVDNLNVRHAQVHVVFAYCHSAVLRTL
jgi:hypothetical protein